MQAELVSFIGIGLLVAILSYCLIKQKIKPLITIKAQLPEFCPGSCKLYK
jgi:hypothetical protein